MDKATAEARIEELRKWKEKADYAYYVLNAPIVGDADYDLKERELLRLVQEHPEFDRPDATERNVAGETVDGFAKVPHSPPMQSLDKTHEKGELDAFDAFLRRELSDGVDWEYVVEPKIDGLSISLRYRNGVLVTAATRGNGIVGDDVTANVRSIGTLPMSLPPDAPRELEVRGEIYMTREGFVRLNEELEAKGEEIFANPRNAAAGSLKQKDPKETAKRPLAAVVYNAGGTGCDSFATHTEMMEAFGKWGFPSAGWSRKCRSIQEVFAAIDELAAMRHSFPFEIDGAVVKVNQRGLYDVLGATAHGPRWARAYKYPPERAETIIHQITVQVGRTGILTPVAELVPVFLSGSTIARATLHNADEIALHDFRVGDHVWLVKAGDVIPALESVVFEKRSGLEVPFEMPKTCPVCGSPVSRRDGEAAHRCTNQSCKARLAERLEHFASRDALDITQIGSSVAEAIVKSDLARDILDIFDVTTEQWANLELSDDADSSRTLVSRALQQRNAVARALLGKMKSGATPYAVAEEYLLERGRKKQLDELRQGLTTPEEVLRKVTVVEATTADKIVSRLSEVKALPLHRWLFAIGIPNVGVTVAKDIAEEHGKFSDLADSEVLKNVVANDALKGRERKILKIKVEAAKAVLAFFGSDYGKAFLARMAALGIDPKSEAKAAVRTEGPLVGAGCVLTGTLSRPRGEYAKMIEQAGGIVQSAVTSKTRYLIAGANVGATKTEKARALGTEVIDEARLRELLSL